jgi:hypothetical protein
MLWQPRVHKTQDKYTLEHTEGAITMKNLEKRQPRVHKTQDKYTLEHTEAAITMKNPEKL